MNSLLNELHRRNLFRVTVVYMVTSWLIIQVVSDISPALTLPDWTLTLVIILLGIGFPLALIFVWAFELTADGIQPSHKVHPSESVRHLMGRNMDFALIAILVIVSIVLYIRLESMEKQLELAQQALVESQTAKSGDVIQERAIAVLPFTNMSQDSSDKYFSDGISEEILNMLARVPDLKVVSRTSSFVYKGDRNVIEIGKELNVPYILEGSVRKSGNMVRITAQLIDASNGFHMWSATYDTELNDIFTVQDDISLAIVEALKLQLLPTEIDNLSNISTTNAFAYDAYLKGRDGFRNASIIPEYLSAIEYFDIALKSDPTFAEAEAQKCIALDRSYDISKDSVYLDAAISSCNRAVTMGPNDAETRIALGFLYLSTGRNEFAIDSFENALAIDPLEHNAYRGLGMAYSTMADPAHAEEAFLRAIEIDPTYAKNHSAFARHLNSIGEYESAVTKYNDAIDLQPDNARFHASLGAILWYLENVGDAAKHFQLAVDLEPSPEGYSNAGTMHYFAGNYELSLRDFEIAAEMLPEHYLIHYNRADACRMVISCTKEMEYYRDTNTLLDDHLRINPDNADAIAVKADVAIRLGKSQQAKQLIEKALDFDADNIEILRAAAIVYSILGDKSAAQSYARKAYEGGYPGSALVSDPDIPFEL